ncbi:AGE family epimerase/isomerase [Telluribacter sp. SYSU D00476]|uniref:AGE family epimerase/isomerase n=1 Tax=Telluribacter sp. SYSU D00476 TaxID=2811430 RepID=UPI001FF3E1E7|nr:AGE family epimerase/isomerase [Telluribacter sp. SYSU D00476]
MLAPFSARAFRQELVKILDYWEKYTPDGHNGFHGRVNYDNQPVADSPRSVVVTSRILWTFAMANQYLHKSKYLTHAANAYQYLTRHFMDQQNGGVYWSVKADGSPLDTKKQIYGQAFAIYGLSEYYLASNHAPALAEARKLYELVEKYSFDPKQGGYREAFAQDWSDTDDYILSKAPWNKSMNTHLHLIEAYTNLYRAWPDARLKEQIKGMMDQILTHIVSDKTHRMRLFFDTNWQPRDEIISYGHDIEASWLLYETAEVLHDEAMTARVRDRAIKMAEAAATGLGKDGALHYEYDPATGHTQYNRSWWVAAEQLVGFYNAYQLTRENHFLEKAKKSWDYIQASFIDKEKGEWHTTVTYDEATGQGAPVRGDKVHFWKGPYHNARACAEMWRRMGGA